MFDDLEQDFDRFVSTMSERTRFRMLKVMLEHSKRWPNHELHFMDAMGSISLTITRPGRGYEMYEMDISDYGRHQRDDRPTDYHRRLRPMMTDLINMFQDYLEWSDRCHFCISDIKVFNGSEK